MLSRIIEVLKKNYHMIKMDILHLCASLHCSFSTLNFPCHIIDIGGTDSLKPTELVRCFFSLRKDLYRISYFLRISGLVNVCMTVWRGGFVCILCANHYSVTSCLHHFLHCDTFESLSRGKEVSTHGQKVQQRFNLSGFKTPPTQIVNVAFDEGLGTFTLQGFTWKRNFRAEAVYPIEFIEY